MMRANRCGSALIEFAFALAIVTPVFMGGLQFFAAYSVAGDVQQAVIQGAEAAAVLPYGSPDETPAATFRHAVEDATLKSGITGLRRDHVKVAMHFDNGRPSEVEVRISGYLIAVPGGAITLDGKPRAMFPYRGRWMR